eukprot:g367.t1
MKSPSLAFAVVLLCSCPASLAANISVHATIDTSKAVSSVLPQYLSVDLDWWHNTTHDCGPDQTNCWGNDGALWLDLKDPLLASAVSALAPGFLRIGGSLDNVINYLVGDLSLSECNAPVDAKGQKWYNLCLNMSRWDDLQQFVRQSGHQLIFGLSYQTTGIDKHWASSNVLDLLNYTARSTKSPVLYGLELGEEMAPAPGSAAFTNLIDAYGELRKAVTQLWPERAVRPKILGPCVGMGNEEPGLGFAFTRAFLNRTLSQGLLDAVVMHSYNNDGGSSWSQPGFLSQTARQAATMLSETRLHSQTVGLWCGECGPHNHGGLENVTDRFISSFWYADALGGLARAGLVEFGRQALLGSNYGLLRAVPKSANSLARAAPAFEPNPDFFTAVLWQRLMGQEVLQVDLTGGGADVQNNLHVYAHCSSTAENGSAPERTSRRSSSATVTLLFINVAAETQFAITPVTSSSSSDGSFGGGGGSGASRLEYHLTAPSLLSTTVLLNGNPLLVEDGQLPLDKLVPREVSPAEPISVAPLSYGFAVLPGGSCPAVAAAAAE